MNRFNLATLKALCVVNLCTFCMNAFADDTLTVHGYLRSGFNFLDSGGAVNNGSCYALSHPRNDGLYYRLGNECRDYGEFLFNKTIKKNDIEYDVGWMMDVAADSRSSTETEGWSKRSRQLYVEATGLLTSGTLWIGRRYYHSIAMGDIHMIDAFHVQSSGNGIGIKNFMLNDTSKLHFAMISYGEADDRDADSVEDTNHQSLLLDFRAETQVSNEGRLSLALQHLNVQEAYEGANPQGGSTLTVQMSQPLGLVEQTTAIQYGIGAMAHNPGCAGTDGGCFDYDADSDATGYRIFNTGMVNVNQKFQVNYLVFYEESEDYWSVTSVGARPHYSFAKHWSIVAELAEISLENKKVVPEQDPQTLLKYTLALQATSDSESFWDRPSMRLYISNFSWNSEAAQVSNLSVPGNESNSATIIGAQVEVWF